MKGGYSKVYEKQETLSSKLACAFCKFQKAWRHRVAGISCKETAAVEASKICKEKDHKIYKTEKIPRRLNIRRCFPAQVVMRFLRSSDKKKFGNSKKNKIK